MKRIVHIVFAVLSVVFVAATVLAAYYYAPLEPVDVTRIVYSSDDYMGGEVRVKGIVQDYTGSPTFALQDVSSTTVMINVTYRGEALGGAIADGIAVYVMGEVESDRKLIVDSVEIADDPDESAGWVSPYSAKIFYFHVPSAWTSFLAFGVVLACSAVYLVKGGQKWDAWALSSAEVGLVFCTVAVISGALWAKAEWGYYWNWNDTKLFSTFVLWLVFVAYVAIRNGAVKHESIPRIAAVFGILGFVAVPISFVSSRIWASLHPNVIATSEGHLSSEAGLVLMLGVLAFTFIYASLFSRRVAIEKSIREIQELKERLEAEE